MYLNGRGIVEQDASGLCWKDVIEEVTGYSFGLPPSILHDFESNQKSYDELTELGRYDFHSRAIVIYVRKIDEFSYLKNLSRDHVYKTTLAHEYSHAISSIGYDRNAPRFAGQPKETVDSTIMVQARMSPRLPRISEKNEEQLAQMLTLAAIKSPKIAEMEQLALMDGFLGTMKHQSAQYHIYDLLQASSIWHFKLWCLRSSAHGSHLAWDKRQTSLLSSSST